MRLRFAALSIIVLTASASAAPPPEKIGIIDFYGYGSLDPAQLRAALPFREGDAIPSKVARQAAEEALVKQSPKA